MKKLNAALGRIKKSFASAHDKAMLVLLTINLAASGSAYAQSVPAGPTGAVSAICKLNSYLSEYVVLAMLAAAAAVYGIMYAINAVREGVMETALRWVMGGGVVISSAALVTYAFGRSVC